MNRYIAILLLAFSGSVYAESVTCDKDWIDALGALLTPVVAFIGIWIAVQQWKINKSRFNHELFDRKYEIFQATQVFILKVLADLEAKQDVLNTFYTATNSAVFIFDQEVVDYLDLLSRMALELNAATRKKDELKMNEISEWFGEQLKQREGVFKDHISL